MREDCNNKTGNTVPRVLGRKIAREVSDSEFEQISGGSANGDSGSSAVNSGFFFDIPEECE